MTLKKRHAIFEATQVARKHLQHLRADESTPGQDAVAGKQRELRWKLVEKKPKRGWVSDDGLIPSGKLT